MLANEARTAPPRPRNLGYPPLPGYPEVSAELAGVLKGSDAVVLSEGELLGDVRHSAADEPERDPVVPVESDGLERNGGETASVHGV